jgi:hypothetical protein
MILSSKVFQKFNKTQAFFKKTSFGMRELPVSTKSHRACIWPQRDFSPQPIKTSLFIIIFIPFFLLFSTKNFPRLPIHEFFPS